MRDVGPVLRECADALDRGEAVVLATVVRVEGSAYRRPGARMLFGASGARAGLVSGGCLESDLAERAGRLLAGGEPQTVVYDMRSPDDLVWGLGLGCNGAISVLLERVERATPASWIDVVLRCRARRRPGAVATVFAVEGTDAAAVGDRLVLGPDGAASCSFEDAHLRRLLADAAAGSLSGAGPVQRSFVLEPGRVDALIEPVVPETALFVFGAGADALPLVSGAAALDWRTIVLDHREAYLRPGRFPLADETHLLDFETLDAGALGIDERSALVLMTHHFLHDATLLERLLVTAAPYVGVIGPRRRTENLLAELKRRGATPGPDGARRLYGPVGLDIGSESPAEIALSILAEIQCVLHEGGGGFLRDREGPLHEPP